MRYSILSLVALASVSVGNPLSPRMEAAGYTMLGYRTVNKAEATAINKHGELVYSKAFDINAQLGIGKSLSGGAGQWDIGINNWYCYVMIHTNTLADLKKIWIPSKYFFTSEANIANYIKSKGLDPAKTLRFAQVEAKPFNELFIPSTMVASEDSNINAECFESIAALTAGLKALDEMVSVVDYTTATFAGPKP